MSRKNAGALALRRVIRFAGLGRGSLDALLAKKDAVRDELAEALRKRAKALGVKVPTAGIRDIILPGDMRDLMNRVTEARKAAEANTEKLIESNPTLMRLRELEVLEKIAGHAKLSVVLGEKGLADRVVNLL